MLASPRLNAFYSMKNHAWFGRVFSRLKNEDIELIRATIIKNDHLGAIEFDYAVNRLFMDKGAPNLPKRWKEICELLSAANSAVHQPVRGSNRKKA